MSTARLGRHFSYNVMGLVLPTAITIFTTPIYLRHVGQERFGVLALLWLVVGYFGVLDLGLSRASANRLAIVSDPTTSAEIFWAAFWTSFAIGCAGAIALYVGGGMLWGSQFEASGSDLGREMRAALPFLALFIPLATCSGVLTGSLEARQQFLTVNAVSVAGSTLFALLPLAVALLFTTSLAWLIPAALVSRVVTFCWLSIAATRALSIRRIVRPARAQVRDLLSFGGWAAVSAFIGTIMNTVDQFAIGAMLGAAAVAHYVVPFNAISRLGIIPTALLRALFPRLSQAEADMARAMEVDALATLCIVMTGICGALILNLRVLLHIWLGAQLAPISVPIAMILTAGIWCNCLANVPYWSLQARRRPHVPARIHLLEALPYCVALLGAMHYFGVLGAAIGWSSRMLIDLILLILASGYSQRVIRPLHWGFLFIIGALAFSLFEEDWRLLIGSTVLIFPIYIFWAFRTSPRLKAMIAGLFRDGLRRLSSGR